ncbi:glycosyltransferase family 2 protein [Methylophaga sp.]|uniref:glycosyltransferase family 2 protein n=1 Tax=Methylophaga sp. TaxID=2024840 RepID=UPI003A950281
MSELSSIKVAVLMCSYNGEQYLIEQLDSIKKQSIQHIDIWVSDDGSSDSTCEILRSYQKEWNKGLFEIKTGPQKGFAANFMSLICDLDIIADYYAFSDQDDIWEVEKLSRALNNLGKNDNNKPALYCSRTKLIAQCGKDLKHTSPLFSKKPSFANAIVQSLAGGNTMVINNKARELVCKAGAQNIISHDWWLYMLVSGADGDIFYDSIPSVKYRQHDNNEIGTNLTWNARLNRIKMVLNGRFCDWNDTNTIALHKNRHLLTECNQRTLDTFMNARRSSGIKQMYLIIKSDVYRQTIIGNIALYTAALFNRL